MSVTSRGPMPFWALFVSIAVFAVPALLTGLRPVPAAAVAVSWLFAVMPVFFFSYFEGWRGTALALAMWVCLLALTLMAAPLVGAASPDWWLVGLLTASLLVISLGIGWLSVSLQRDLNAAVVRERTVAEQLALRDELTGLPNAKYARLYLDGAFAAAERGFPLTVVLLDLDRFSDYRAYHGRAAADAALRAVGHVLGKTTRRMELSARTDADRFLSVLNTRDSNAALKFVRRVRHALLEVDLPAGRVTVSSGIASYQSGIASGRALLDAAEAALADAQALGRERDATRMPAAPESAS
jgi:diguanylate cyclase (GGDEF)-like protein